MTKQAIEYVIKWIDFEIDKTSIMVIEPEEKAMETAYYRLTELDELSCELSEEELLSIEIYAGKIEENSNNPEALKIIKQELLEA